MSSVLPKVIRADVPLPSGGVICAKALQAANPMPLRRIASQPAWRYQLPAAGHPGSVWNLRYGTPKPVLEWCPEVLTWLVSRNEFGDVVAHHYTVRVCNTLVTFADSRLVHGSAWAAFPDIDLWDCLALQDQLHEIVRAQARRLPFIEFPEIAE